MPLVTDFGYLYYTSSNMYTYHTYCTKYLRGYHTYYTKYCRKEWAYMFNKTDVVWCNQDT